MMIGVDGSGESHRETYDKRMLNSFVNRLGKDYQGEGRFIYHRGPGHPWKCPHILKDLLPAAKIAAKANEPLYLAGYSRGAAIAVAIARSIKEEVPKARIEVLALFDGVEMGAGIGNVDIIPGNVGFAYHARRALNVHSRPFFNNCGTSAEKPCEYTEESFRTTHGGMGGVLQGKDVLEGSGWWGRTERKIVVSNAARILAPSIVWEERLRHSERFTSLSASQEASGSDSVHEWMWNNLREHKLVA